MERKVCVAALALVSSLLTSTIARAQHAVHDAGKPVDDAAQAATQKISVGETFDFEYQAPAGRQLLWINVRTPAGRWEVQGRVIVK